MHLNILPKLTDKCITSATVKETTKKMCTKI